MPLYKGCARAAQLRVCFASTLVSSGCARLQVDHEFHVMDKPIGH